MSQLWCLEVARRSPEEVKALSSEEILGMSSKVEKLMKSSKKKKTKTKKIMEDSRKKTRKDNPPQYVAAPAQPPSYLQVPYEVAQLHPSHLVPFPYPYQHYQQPFTHQPHQYQQQPTSQYQQLPVWTGIQPPGALAKPAVTPGDSDDFNTVTAYNQAVEARIRNDEEKDVLANTTITSERKRKVEEEVERKRIEGIMERMTSNILALNNVVSSKMPCQNMKHLALETASISRKSEECEWKSKETASQSESPKHKRIRCGDNSASEEKSADLRFNKDNTKSLNQAEVEGEINIIGAPEVWDMETIKVPASNIVASTRLSSPREPGEQLSSSSEEQSSAGLTGADAGLSALAVVCDESSETHATETALSETDDRSVSCKKGLVAAAASARRIPDGAKTEVQEDGIATVVPMKGAEVATKPPTGKKPQSTNGAAEAKAKANQALSQTPVEAAAFARWLPDNAKAEVQDGIATIVPMKRAMSATEPPTGKKPQSSTNKAAKAKAKAKANQTPVVDAAFVRRWLSDNTTAEVQDGIATIVPLKRAMSATKPPTGKKPRSTNVAAKAKARSNQTLFQTAASPLGLQAQTSQIVSGQPVANPMDGYSQIMQGQVMAPGQVMPCGIAQCQYGMPQPYVYHQPPAIAVCNTQLAQPMMQPAIQVNLGVQQTFTPTGFVISNPAPAQGVVGMISAVPFQPFH